MSCRIGPAARRLRAFGGAAVIVSFAAVSPRLLADEGMWLFNRLPVDALRAHYGFDPDADWARHLMRSSVRISLGGSGSVVSPRGLVLTNHHVVSECVQELSTAEKNYIEDGFIARSFEEELRCPGTEVLVLWEIEDVTASVQAAAGPGADPGAADLARRARIAAIESDSQSRTGLHSEVVTLYKGGEYHLYRYRRYDDVRLVMAPEVSVAFFGGDADNFEFPRHCLDMSLLRLYENGEPAKMEHWLSWSSEGTEPGDLIFVSGHPGATQRHNTADHLLYLRDVQYTSYLDMLYRREVALQQFSIRGEEPARLARDDLFGIQNSRKAVRGILAGLQDPAIFSSRARSELVLRSQAAARPELGASAADWDRIAESLSVAERMFDEHAFLERGRGFWSQLYGHAATIVRLAGEREKPSADRLPEYRDSALPRLELRLYSPAPIERDLEIWELSDSLTALASALGAEHPIVELVLGGRSPADRAYDLVSRTELHDVEARRRLVASGKAGVEESRDAMIELARAVEPFSRSQRERYDRLVSAVQTEAYGRIARASFALTGTSVYPDATFTLRLAFGVIKGWQEAGKEIAPYTTLGGLYRLGAERGGVDPYRVPASWEAARAKVDAATPFNFVSTADIIGGNSGSPVVDRSGRLVGLIFDGNIHSLVLDIVYTEERARAVAVDARAILEALEKVYGLERLVDELSGG